MCVIIVKKKCFCDGDRGDKSDRRGSVPIVVLSAPCKYAVMRGAYPDAETSARTRPAGPRARDRAPRPVVVVSCVRQRAHTRPDDGRSCRNFVRQCPIPHATCAHVFAQAPRQFAKIQRNFVFRPRTEQNDNRFVGNFFFFVRFSLF